MKTKFGQNSFAYRGAKIWNSLPNDCRKSNAFPTFKRKLKAMLAKHHLLYFTLSFFELYFNENIASANRGYLLHIYRAIDLQKYI